MQTNKTGICSAEEDVEPRQSHAVVIGVWIASFCKVSDSFAKILNVHSLWLSNSISRKPSYGKNRKYKKMHVGKYFLQHCSVQFSSVAQSCPTLCNPMNRSTPGLPVHHQLPEFTQTHIYRVSEAIQPSHPLSSPSAPAPHPSQHQSLFQWVNSSREVAKVLEFQL